MIWHNFLCFFYTCWCWIIQSSYNQIFITKTTYLGEFCIEFDDAPVCSFGFFSNSSSFLDFFAMVGCRKCERGRWKLTKFRLRLTLTARKRSRSQVPQSLASQPDFKNFNQISTLYMNKFQQNSYKKLRIFHASISVPIFVNSQ